MSIASRADPPRRVKSCTAARPATLESIEHFKSTGEPVVLVVPPEGAVYMRPTLRGQRNRHDS